MATGIDRRLDAVSKICLALPEAVRLDQGSHASFLVRKKVFVYYLNNHHGDCIVSVCCKVLKGDNQMLATSQPERFYLPAYIAHRGWVALRLDVGKVDWDEVKELVTGSYSLTAPKRLIPESWYRSHHACPGIGAGVLWLVGALCCRASGDRLRARPRWSVDRSG